MNQGISKGRLSFFVRMLSLWYYETRSNLYYRVMQDLFETASEGSGILNIGYSEDLKSVSLLDAQKNLVSLSTANLCRPPGASLLDVGCGVGGPACFLAKEHPDIQIRGININALQLKEAQHRARTEGVDTQVSFRYGNAAAIPFPADSFDGVYAIETAFHYPDKAAFAREAFRVLKPGAGFAVADIVLDFKNSSVLNPLHVRFGKLLMASPELYTPQKWRHALKNVGFKNVQAQDITMQTFGLISFWNDKINENRAYLLKRYPVLMLDTLQWSMEFFAHRLATTPFGYFLVTAEKL